MNKKFHSDCDLKEFFMKPRFGTTLRLLHSANENVQHSKYAVTLLQCKFLA